MTKSHKVHSKHAAHHNAHQGEEHVHPAQHHTAHHASHKTKKKDNVLIWQIATAVFAVLFVISLATGGFGINNDGSTTKTKTTKTNNLVEKVDGALDVELYVMSQCPYGVQAENTMFQAIKEIGLENFNLNVDYIATDLGGGEFDSLHGDAEAQGDIVQLCVNEHAGQQAYLDVVLCMNKNSGSIPGNWESCAKGLDTDAIKTCYEGDEGKELLSKSILKAQSRQATGSPTIIVNDNRYSGGREVLDFKRAFCGSFETQPEGCADVPAAVKFDVIVLNDEKCGSSCDPSGVIGPTQSYFPGANIIYLDASTKDGKDYINKYGIEVVPTIIFGVGVEDTEMWKNDQFQLNFDDLGGGVYKLKDEITQASYYLDEKKQQEAFAKKGVTLGDNKPQIDFFVMSYCPYGNQAEEEIVGAYNLLKDYAEFKPHYIYYENYQGGGDAYCLDADSKYCSMHGAQEARQNIREQCVEAKYGIGAWFDFATAMNSDCTAQNADTCYVDVAKNLGYDLDYIKECQETKALEFAAEDLRLSTLYGASGSPSVYIDGIAYNGARTATGFQAGLCDAFDNAPSVCDGIVVETTPTAAPTGQC
ncbi:hypothetical protein JXA48_03135 [Candidatus Woesearchaeota archaeon]|nr:hypothetical protein [Candidatus Woesearchaeota archaeon]